MSNIYEFVLKPYWAYTLNQDDIIYFHKKISEYCDKTADISVTYKKGIIIKSDNPLNVIEDPMNYVNHIDSIFMSSSKYSNNEISRSASISIQTSNVIEAVKIRASGPRDNCAVFRSDIEGFLSSKKEWYSFLYYSYIFSSVIACVIGYICHVIFGRNGFYDVSSNLNSALMTAIWVGMFFALTSNIFKRLSLDIGKDLRSKRIIRSIFYFAVVVFALNIVTGVGGNFVYDYIKSLIDRRP